MKLIALTFLSLFTFCSAAQEYYMLVGTYDSPRSEGIYVYRFSSDRGTAVPVSQIRTSNPSFLAVSPDEKFVYAVSETAPQGGKGGEVDAFTFNKNSGTLVFINRVFSGGDHPCHVETDRTGKWVFASNYTSGTLSVLPVRPDGSLGTAITLQHTGSGAHPQRQKGPHVHGAIVSPDNRQLLVTDLGIDKVMLYSFDAITGKLSPAKQPYVISVPGSGPRLLTFHPNNKTAYVIEEISGTVVGYKYAGGRLKQIQRISTLPVGDTLPPGSADIHVSPDGKFLYASNRGSVNSIAIYRIGKKGLLKQVGHQPVLGKTPRNFSLDPTGRYLLCANQNSDEIVIFKREENTGLLTDTGNRISAGKPVCIKWINVK